MNLFIKPVPLQYVHQTWPLVEEYIRSAETKAGATEYNLDHIKAYVASGAWSLLVVVDENDGVHGALTVNFINYPNARVAFVTAIGGKLVTNEDTVKQLQDVCRANGATKIQGLARESVAKLWAQHGFSQRAILVEYTL